MFLYEYKFAFLLDKYLAVGFLNHMVQCVFTDYKFFFFIEIQIKYRSNHSMLVRTGIQTPKAATLAS